MTQHSLPSPRLVLSALCVALLAPGCIVTGVDADSDTDVGDGSGTAGDDDGGATDGADSTGGIPGDCVELTQADVAGDATLPAGCYSVGLPLQVGGRLDIEGGAELYFASSASLMVGDGAVLSAVGTADLPVLMTAASAEGWQGVRYVASASSDNRLEHVIVEDAAEVAVTVGATARLTILASEISGAAEVGVEATEGADISIAQSTFAGNGIPIAVGIDGVPGVGADNTFDGNATQVVQVGSGTVSSTAQWPDPGIPLRLTGHIDVAGALTLDPGLEIQMPQDETIEVTTEGSLTAVGTAESPITLHGVEDERGYWQGISFASKATANMLSHCVVANGGSDQWNGSSESRSMIWIADEGKVVISDSTLSGSGGTALTGFTGGDIVGFANNTLEGNASVMLLGADMVHMIGDGNTFVGNDEAFVRVERPSAGSNTRIEAPGATWQALDVPYRVMGRFFVATDWTVGAGATIEVAQDIYFEIEDDGSMSAVGTADAPIVIRGAEALPGYWKGIAIRSYSAANEMRFVQLSGGGSDGFNGAADSDGMLFLDEGSLNLSDSSVSDSGGYGVGVWSDGQLGGCSNVTFSGNAKGDVYVAPNQGGTSAC